MGSSWSRRDRIIRLAKLRGDKAALAIMEAQTTTYNDRPYNSFVGEAVSRRQVMEATESELRALWGDR